MNTSSNLAYRGFINQTTFKDIKALDKNSFSFYLGIDPSADSLTVGHLVGLNLAKHLVNGGHKAFLLVGGATGMVGDPDGKASERSLLTIKQIQHNKSALAKQYYKVMGKVPFKLVDNYDWFKDFKYLDFLREVGKHVPLRQMLGREFVETRLDTTGISYAEFSYCLIQAYDFLHLNQNHGVNLQICGADQWGNCIAGVDLIRRKVSQSVDVLSTPLILNELTGHKFGKTEEGAVWLDPNKTSVTSFYQFWMGIPDQAIDKYLKIYTFLPKEEIESIVAKHSKNPKSRYGQERLAEEVTTQVHGKKAADQAKEITAFLTLKTPISKISSKTLKALRKEISSIKSKPNGSIIEALTKSGLVRSNSAARELINAGAVSINGQVVKRTEFEADDYQDKRLLLKKGKAFKDSALVEL